MWGGEFQRSIQIASNRTSLNSIGKRVETAQINARRIYRLRITGADAYGICAQLKRDGLGCLVVG
jgi:hypothetical protein